MSFSTKENEQFVQEILNTRYILDDVVDYIISNYEPEDIFDKDTLETWAEDNGYVKEES